MCQGMRHSSLDLERRPDLRASGNHCRTSAYRTPSDDPGGQRPPFLNRTACAVERMISRSKSRLKFFM
jgi:hypothetical protein